MPTDPTSKTPPAQGEGVPYCRHGWTDEDGCPNRCGEPTEIGSYCRLHVVRHPTALLDLYTAAIEAKERAEARWQAGRDEDPPFDAQEWMDCFEKSTTQEIVQEAYGLGLERGRIQRIATLERELDASMTVRHALSTQLADVRDGWKQWHRKIVDVLGLDFVERQATLRAAADLRTQLATANAKLREMEANEKRYQSLVSKGWYLKRFLVPADRWGVLKPYDSRGDTIIGTGGVPNEAIDAALASDGAGEGSKT